MILYIVLFLLAHRGYIDLFTIQTTPPSQDFLAVVHFSECSQYGIIKKYWFKLPICSTASLVQTTKQTERNIQGTIASSKE